MRNTESVDECPTHVSIIPPTVVPSHRLDKLLPTAKIASGTGMQYGPEQSILVSECQNIIIPFYNVADCYGKASLTALHLPDAGLGVFPRSLLSWMMNSRVAGTVLNRAIQYILVFIGYYAGFFIPQLSVDLRILCCPETLQTDMNAK